MADYTPGVDFDFTGLTDYTPSPDFDFTPPTEGESLVWGQLWTLEAGGAETGYPQQWAQTAPEFGDRVIGQVWSLPIYTYLEYGTAQRWALAAPVFRDTQRGALWALAAPVFRSLAPDTRWALAAPLFASLGPGQQWGQTAPAFGNTAPGQAWALIAPAIYPQDWDQGWRLEASAVWTRVISATAYIFALEQDTEGRTEIPISNFSGQLRSGDPSYLQASIPNATAWAETLAAYAAHDDTEMVINAGYRWSDGSYTTQEIARVTLRNVRLDYGAQSSTISLDGIDTRTNPTPGTHTLTGASYRSIADTGLVRYRVSMDFNVRPGDTVTVGSDTFIVGELSYQVSDSAAQMEVAELAVSQ